MTRQHGVRSGWWERIKSLLAERDDAMRMPAKNIRLFVEAGLFCYHMDNP